MSDTAEKGIRVHSYEQEMRGAYLNYGMSVIVSRALPDVRDGLKPVHRRIIFGMQEGGYHANKPHKKSARIVGDVIGKYHPHGDQSVYDSMVRLAQPWSIRYPLIDGQGNFGSVDGDPPAAMRYTEAKMSRLAMEMVADLDRGTVPFGPNYDNNEREPLVLPARFPNLLVNGQIGIAVGMATNIPTHNLTEAINAALLIMDRPDATLEELMEIMPGPDFPTSGVIQGRAGIIQSYATGRGRIIICGVARIETNKRGGSSIIMSELPYLVNKEELVKKIVELVNEKKIEGVRDARDESGREEETRVVVEVKADNDPLVVLNQIKKLTRFQDSFSVNMTCIDSKGKPREMPLRDMLSEFIAFRRQTVRLRTQHDLDKARAEQIKQIGLYAAVSEVDKVVATIRSSADSDEARVRLMAMEFPVDDALAQMIRESDPDEDPGATFKLSDVQADAILALTLRRLTGLERDNIIAGVGTLQTEIRVFLGILGDQATLDNVVRQEMVEIREKYGDKRRTVIEQSEADEIEDESLIDRKDVIVTLTNTGYVKRTELATYRAQKRGGKGRLGMETKEDDFVVSTIACTTRTPLLVFTSRGQAQALKAFRLPEAGANAKGRPIVNYLDLAEGERVTSIVPLPEDRAEFEHKSIVFVTDFGTIRRNRVTDFLDLRKGGKIAMKLESGDGSLLGKLVQVLIVNDDEDVMITTNQGMCTRYAVDEVRIFSGRDSTGVRAISLKDKDFVVSACVLPHSDADSLERDVYLSGGTSFIREADLAIEGGGRKETAKSLTFTPAPEADKPDRLMVAMDADRYLQMKREEVMILSVSEGGFGKRTSSHEYRVVSTRGGNGITAANITDKTGLLAACVPVKDADGLVLVTNGGQTIRTRISDVSVLGRATQGFRLLSIPEGQKIVGIAVVPADEDGDDEPAEEQAVASE